MRSAVTSGISPNFLELSQSQGQVAHVLLTRSPLIPHRSRITVRLACVKHAASVRPEPGSNSPNNPSTNHSGETPQTRLRPHTTSGHQPKRHAVEISNTHRPATRTQHTQAQPTRHPPKYATHNQPSKPVPGAPPGSRHDHR